MLFHLFEPTLLALVIGMSLQISQLATILYLFITLVLMMPILLTARADLIKFKFVLSIVLVVLSVGFIIMKSLLYTVFPLNDTQLQTFLGVYPGQFAMTFVPDIFLFVFSLLLVWCYTIQMREVKEKEVGSALKYQTKIKFQHILFGKSENVFFWIASAIFFTEAMLYPTFVPMIFSLCFLGMLYYWSLGLDLELKLL